MRLGGEDEFVHHMLSGDVEEEIIPMEKGWGYCHLSTGRGRNGKTAVSWICKITSLHKND